MGGISRRVFLKGSSAAAVAVGTIAAIPAAPAVLSAIEAQGPADSGAAEAAATEGGAELSSDGAAVIAHVQDLASGEIAVFSGTREVTLVDPQLARLLARAIR